MALPGRQAAGAFLGPWAGEGGLEGQCHRSLECLVLEQVLVDCMGCPGALLLDVFKGNAGLKTESRRLWGV